MSQRKKKKQSRGVVRKPRKQDLTVEQVMKHPVVQRMASELNSLKRLLQGLPEAVGRAVAEAQKSGKPFTPPPMPIENPELLEDSGKDGLPVVNLQAAMGDAREKTGLPREVPDTKKKDKLPGDSGGRKGGKPGVQGAGDSPPGEGGFVLRPPGPAPEFPSQEGED